MIRPPAIPERPDWMSPRALRAVDLLAEAALDVPPVVEAPTGIHAPRWAN